MKIFARVFALFCITAVGCLPAQAELMGGSFGCGGGWGYGTSSSGEPMMWILTVSCDRRGRIMDVSLECNQVDGEYQIDC